MGKRLDRFAVACSLVLLVQPRELGGLCGVASYKEEIWYRRHRVAGTLNVRRGRARGPFPGRCILFLSGWNDYDERRAEGGPNQCPTYAAQASEKPRSPSGGLCASHPGPCLFPSITCLTARRRAPGGLHAGGGQLALERHPKTHGRWCYPEAPPQGLCGEC